jgi:hypothetical protein
MQKTISWNKINIHKLTEKQLVSNLLSPHVSGLYFNLCKERYKAKPPTTQDQNMKLNGQTLDVDVTFINVSLF